MSGIVNIYFLKQTDDRYQHRLVFVNTSILDDILIRIAECLRIPITLANRIEIMLFPVPAFHQTHKYVVSWGKRFLTINSWRKPVVRLRKVVNEPSGDVIYYGYVPVVDYEFVRVPYTWFEEEIRRARPEQETRNIIDEDNPYYEFFQHVRRPSMRNTCLFLPDNRVPFLCTDFSVIRYAVRTVMYYYKLLLKYHVIESEPDIQSLKQIFSGFPRLYFNANWTTARRLSDLYIKGVIGYDKEFPDDSLFVVMG